MHDPRMIAMMNGQAGGGCCELPRGNDVIHGFAGGGLVRVTPKVSYATSSTSAEEYVLAKYIDTTGWVSGALIVRVHDTTIAASDTIKVIVQATSYAEEEPSSDFVESTNPLASVTISNSNPGTVPGMLIAAISTPITAHQSYHEMRR